MPIVTFVEHDGTPHEINLSTGLTLMEGAVSHALNGITGECSGSMACGTCHCFIDEAWISKTGTASQLELDLLEHSVINARPTSRLGCQIAMTEELNGLVVHLPESQY